MEKSNTPEALIEGFLPVRRGDFERARLLLTTLRHFSHPIQMLTVSVPRRELDEANSKLAGFGGWIRLVADEDLLELSRPIRFLRWLGVPLGARIQMLLKLKFTARSKAAAVLMLDADCLLVRDSKLGDFLSSGRLLTVRYPSMNHARWYKDSAAILGVEGLRRSHGVTPALLHPQSVRRLFARLGGAVSGKVERRLILTRRIWTEYALYFTSFEPSGDYDAVHQEISYDTWYASAVWHPKDWDGWMVGDQVSNIAEGGQFSLVQSWVGISPLEIERRLREVWPMMDFDTWREGMEGTTSC